jgi:hypothetical protein
MNQKVTEKTIERAATMLGFLDEDAVIRQLEDTGVKSEIAYLSVKAAQILVEDREKVS